MSLADADFSSPRYPQQAHMRFVPGGRLGMGRTSVPPAKRRFITSRTAVSIDRIAREGALFTDYDARQSCTAGRAAFITGRQDPWERYQDESMMYARWWGDKLWTMVPGVNIVGRFLLTFKESPPSQVGGSFSIERALQMVQNGASGGK